jgi:YesN/AraC family two-component response regulator
MSAITTLSKRILIVDDEATLAFFLRRELQDAVAHCQVDVASSGEDALTKLTYSPCDLLITDLNMPGISGFTLVKVARSLYPQVQVILMTAYGSQEVRDETRKLKVQGFFVKPFPTADLRDCACDVLAGQTFPSVTDNV